MGKYIVTSGDSLSKIARLNGTTVDELIKLNNITDPNKIRIGQELKLKSDILEISVPTQWSGVSLWALQILDRFTRTAESARQAVQARRGADEKANANVKVPMRPQAISEEKSLAINLQLLLYNLGYDIGKAGVDGNFGKDSKVALAKALSEGYVLENGRLVKPKKELVLKTSDKVLSNRIFNPDITKENVKKLGTNFLRSPLQATNDAVLYGLDVMGIPTNATNYLRDLNVSIPYRAKNAINAVFDTFNNEKSFKKNYEYRLENPSLFVQNTTINPLINSNHNFSKKELAVIRDAAGSDFKIGNADVKRVLEDGKYGGKGAISQYFSPDRVFATALGQTNGNPEDKTITDLFDVNTKSKEAQKDNNMYVKMLLNNLKSGNYLTYENLRALMPWLNMTDVMPDLFKIPTKIRYEN